MAEFPICLTNAGLIRELRKPGRVYVPALILGGAQSVQAVKADVISILRDLDPEAPAPWAIYGRDADSISLDWTEV